MDILNPELIWIEGRCYRYFEETAWAKNRVQKCYAEEDYDAEMENEETGETDIEILPQGDSKYKHSFHVPKELFPFLIGGKHATQKRIESETKTSIQFPKAGQDGDIVIIGHTHKGIISARHRIDVIMAASKKKLQATHILSIPLNTEEIIKNFEQFKKDVLDNYEKNTRGINASLFQTPSKLHCTMGTLKLLDDEERKQAIRTLNCCKTDIIKPLLEKYGPIQFKLKGVECMNDDPGEVNVLYAKVDSEDNKILQEFVDKITDYFSEKGLMQKERENIKIHITLMNTKFQHEHQSTFDAKQIIQAHKDTFFGEITLNEIHLSQLHTRSNTGYYQATAIVNLQE